MTGAYDHELEGTLLAAVVALRSQPIPKGPMRSALEKATRIDRPRLRGGMWRWALASAVAAAVAVVVWRQLPGTLVDHNAAQGEHTMKKPQPMAPPAWVGVVPRPNKDGLTPVPVGAEPSPSEGFGGVPRGAKGAFAGLRVSRRVVAVPSAKIVVSTGPKEPVELGQAAGEGDIQLWHVHVWDVAKGGKSRALRTEAQEGFAVSPDGKWLVTTSGRRIDVDADQESKLDGMAEVTRVAFAPDGKTLLALAGPQADGTMRVFDWPAMKLRQQLPDQFGYMFAYAFSGDGRRAVLVDKERHLRIWDLQTGGAVVRTEKPHSNSVRALALSPDGQWLVSSGPGNEIWLWDAATGKHVRTLPAHQQYGLPGEMACLTFSSDSKRLAGGGPQNLVVWDVATGELVKQLESASGGSVAIWFSDDQNEITAIRDFHSYRNQAGVETDIYPSMRRWTVKKEN